MSIRLIHRGWKGVQWLRLLSIVFLFLLTLALFHYQYLQNPFSFNSDNLYCLQFCDDLLHGRDMEGFHVPAAPYLFPDMVLLLPCAALTSNLSAVFFLYSAVYYTLLLAMLVAIFRGIGLSGRTSFAAAGLGVTFFLAAHFDPAYAAHAMLMSHAGNHMGCILIGLAAAAFIQRALRDGYGWRSTVLFVLACALGGFSDQLLIVQFLTPIAAVVLLLGAFRLVPARRAIIAIALLGLSTVLVLKGHILFEKIGLVPMRVTHIESGFFKDVSGALEQFAASWWYLAKNQPLLWVVLLLHLTGAVAVIAVWSRRCRRTPAPFSGSASGPCLDGTSVLFIALVLLLAPLTNAAALIVTGTNTPATVARYLYTWWFLPFLCLLLWPSLLPWRSARLLPWAVVAVVGFRLLTYPEALNKDGFTPRYPPLARALDEMVRKHGPLRGFAEYWHTREMKYLTKQHVDVLPALRYGAPWFHSINPNAYLSDDPHDLAIPDYHFVVFAAGEPGPDREQIRARYGEPVEIISIEGYDIWRYERMINRQLDLFLRAQLAQRLVRNKPFLVPAQPARLRQPKRNLTPCTERGNIHLQRGEPLTVRFEKPVTGAMIDISGHFLDEYALLFLRDGEELGATRVPPVAWTGAESAYSEPGLQSRLVPVPLACRAGGFDEVRITSIGRLADATLGHFLVFDEWIPYRSERGRLDKPYRRHEGEKLTHPDSLALTAVTDSSASGGMAWRAASTFQGCMAFGPYLPLSPGHYCVDFALAAESNTSSDVAVTIDSCAFSGRQILASRTLRGVDFAAPGRYEVFRITFDVEEELDLVEFRAVVHGKTAMMLDYVDVTRVAPAATSEMCEP